MQITFEARPPDISGLVSCHSCFGVGRGLVRFQETSLLASTGGNAEGLQESSFLFVMSGGP